MNCKELRETLLAIDVTHVLQDGEFVRVQRARKKNLEMALEEHRRVLQGLPASWEEAYKMHRITGSQPTYPSFSSVLKGLGC